MRGLTRHLGLSVVAVFVVAACGGTSNNTSATCSESTAKTATSASACGGMDALVAAAKAEGKLNIIATPPDWANYGEAINGFKAKYGIDITSDNPNGSSQDEINAVTQLGTSSRAPDVLDMGKAVTLANLQLYAPTRSPHGTTSSTARRTRPGCGGRTTAATCRSATTRPRC